MLFRHARIFVTEDQVADFVFFRALSRTLGPHSPVLATRAGWGKSIHWQTVQVTIRSGALRCVSKQRARWMSGYLGEGTGRAQSIRATGTYVVPLSDASQIRIELTY